MKELIHFIVKEIFGEDFANISQIIYERGQIDLKGILIESKYPFKRIKEILLILIKNNFIEFIIPNPDNLPEPSANAEYKVCFTSILNTLRYPIFLDLINKLYSKNDKDCLIAKNIVELFLLETSLTVSDILLNFQEGLEENEIKYKTPIEENDILRVLIGLIRDNFISRVSQSSITNIPFKEEDTENEEEKKENINSKRKRKGKEKVPAKGRKKLKLQEDALNFLHEIPNELKVLTESESLLKIDQKIIKKGEEPQKLEKIEKNHALLIDASNKEILLQINFRQFIHELRTNAIVEMVEEKISLPAAFIIQSMLKTSKCMLKAFDAKQTESLAVEQILKILPSQMKIESQSLISQLEVLKNDNGNFVVEKSVTENFITLKKYSVNIANIIKNLQFKVYEKILAKIYSPFHVRIFRILMKFHNLDDKKISEFAMIPVNEARKYIHELFKDNVLSTQEINDENDNKISVYFIKHKMLVEKIKENFHKTIYNLKIQKSKIEEKLNDPLQNLDVKGKELLLSKLFKLESAILEVDSSLLIYSEF